MPLPALLRVVTELMPLERRGHLRDEEALEKDYGDPVIFPILCRFLRQSLPSELRESHFSASFLLLIVAEKFSMVS
jgi:hypothetical protein